jgi:hypothetical protein
MTVTRDEYAELERHAAQIALLIEHNKQATRYHTKNGIASFNHFRFHAIVYGVKITSRNYL